MERQPGLSGTEIAGELADAALAASKHLENLETRRIGESVEELSGSGEVGSDCGSHG